MAEIAPQNPINSLKGPRLTPAGKPITPIVKNAFSAREIHKGLWDADASNRLTRAWVQGILEGKPPYDPAVMRNAGLASCCNLDWRDGQLAIRKKMVPYVEALNSLPTFMRIKTSFGASQSERDRFGRIMSEKHKKLLKTWDAFHFRYLYKILYLTSHGIAFAYFDNKDDWRWNVSCPGDMVVPRLSRADSTEFDIVSTYRDFQPHELYNFIRTQGKNAKWTEEGNEGFHVPTVRQMIMRSGTKDMFRANDWELSERLIKNNEIYYSWTNQVCQCIVQYAKETDGSVTQMIVSKDSMEPETNKRRKKGETDEKEQFLYRETGFYNSMKEGLIVFARDIGTNGDFHSIRGTGSDIFPMVQKLNELKCGLFDATEVQMSIPIQASEEILSNEFAYTKSGPFLIINQNVKMLDRQNPNFSQSALPAMDMIQRGFLEQQGERMQPEGKPPEDLEGLLDNLSGIDVMESTLWHTRWEMLLQQSLRRLINIKSQAEPGGVGALLFRKWCMNEGVPSEAIDNIIWDESDAVRAIGNGSPQGRLFTLDRMEKVVPQLDDEGRRNWVRDYIAALPGTDQSHVDRYAPQEPDMRPGVEVKIAMMENQIIMNGGSVEPLPDEPHLSHVEVHIKPMLELQQKVETGEMDEAEAVVPLMPLFMHAQAHLQMAGQDPMQKHRINMLRQALHNMGEIITNGERKRLKMQEEQAQQKGADGQPPVDPVAQAKAQAIQQKSHLDFLKAQSDLGMAGQNAIQAEQLHNMKMAQQRAKITQSRQDMNLKDISTAAKIAAS